MEKEKKILLTGEQWTHIANVKFGLVIMDMDGFKSESEFKKAKINKKMYLKKLAMCTVQMKKDVFKYL